MGGGEVQAEDVGRHGCDGRSLMHFGGHHGGMSGAWRPSPPVEVQRWRRSTYDLDALAPNRRRIHGFGQAIVGAMCHLILLW
jgi:hypothetical protein